MDIRDHCGDFNSCQLWMGGLRRRSDQTSVSPGVFLKTVSRLCEQVSLGDRFTFSKTFESSAAVYPSNPAKPRQQSKPPAQQGCVPSKRRSRRALGELAGKLVGNVRSDLWLPGSES